MKYFFRKRRHIEYMSQRITELHMNIINLSLKTINSERCSESIVYELNHMAKLLKKYNRRIRIVRL